MHAHTTHTHAHTCVYTYYYISFDLHTQVRQAKTPHELHMYLQSQVIYHLEAPALMDKSEHRMYEQMMSQVSVMESK